MRTIDPNFAAHLATGVTTLCRCWRLERSDGVVLGFTDHDRDVSFDGVTYEPESGFDASEDTSATGFGVGGLEALGALSSDRLDGDDLAAGLYDNAEVRVFMVNWTTPDERHLLRLGHLGEMTRADGAFRAEVRGLAAALDEPNGRAFRHACDADLGDERCGVDLDDPAHRGEGTVTVATDRRRFTVDGLGAFAAGLVRAGQPHMDERRQRGPCDGSAGAPRGRRRGDDRAVAGDALRRCGGRCVHRHRRLRQALLDLRGEVRQHGQLPRLPAYPRQ